MAIEYEKTNSEEKGIVELVKNKTQEIPEGVLDKIKQDILLIEPQARMEFLKEQFALAQKDARETNEGALKEILPILEKIKALYLNPKYRGMEFQKERFEKMEEVLENYSGDMSGFMESLADIWKNFDPFSNQNGNVYKNKIVGEPLIKAFKKYLEDGVKDFPTARTASFIMSKAVEKLEEGDISLE